MKTILIATKNRGKAKEFDEIFKPMGYQVLTLLDMTEDLDVEETGITFEENAILKAETISKYFGIPVLADDSGLIIDALEGRPGVFSARYAGPEKDDLANMDKVLSEMKGIKGNDRTARFHCSLALALPDRKTITTFGTVEGYIAEEPAGTNGFGYDPIFYVPTYDKTMAQLTSEEKNNISHRHNAIQKLKRIMNELFNRDDHVL
ncbi:XTP/dITP diphosphatase [Peribacillus acanthi]|uniref:XTP/dITP diphosphatase n=1 Tax=Peribacillus acanthi TaxID=2171554 RepID=UPI000D3EC328|nr:XTP/dITP diphosphatase [Peribacillus acanthi]